MNNLDDLEDKLEGYVYIDNNNMNKLKKGGYIKYLDQNHKLKYGGILVNLEYDGIITDVVKKNSMTTKLKLYLKSNKGIYHLNFIKYYIFFKPHRTYNDKLRDIFLKKIEESNEFNE